MFTFLNTIILSAIGLALIPLLIHLLNRKKPQPVAFSSLRFLKMLQQKQIKNLRIRQIILLILRTLIILFCVLAFARPTWRSGARPPVQSHERTSLIMILDHSLSTTYRAPEGIVFDRLKLKALEILRYLGENDEILLLTAPPGEGDAQAEFTGQFSEIESRIRRLSPVYSVSKIWDQMELAIRLMNQARHPNREIVVLSDFQKSDFENGGSLDTLAAHSNPEPYWLFVNGAPKEIRNISIDTAQLITRLIEKNRPVTVRVRLRNASRSPAEDLNLQMYFNRKKVLQQTVTLAPEETTELDLTAMVSSSGFTEAKIEIDDDALTADNSYYFHFFVPDQIRTVLVHSGVSSVRFIEFALRPDPQFHTPVVLQSVPASRWSSVRWDDVDVAVLYDLTDYDEVRLQTIGNLFKSGKGILFIPGESSDSVGLEKFLNRFQLGRLSGKQDYTSRPDAYLTLGEMNRQHVLLRGIFEKTSADPIPKNQSPRIDQYWRLQSEGRGIPLIRLNNGDPLLIEHRYNDGRIIFLTSAPDLKWNDLPLHALFPPLIHRTVFYLYSPPENGTTQLQAGQPADIRIRSTDGLHISLSGEGAATFKPVVKSLGDEFLIRIPPIQQPGSYRILNREKPILWLSVNTPSGENRLVYLTKEEKNKVINRHASAQIETGEPIEEYILLSRYGYELWKVFLIIVLVLMLTEIALAQAHRFEK